MRISILIASLALGCSNILGIEDLPAGDVVEDGGPTGDAPIPIVSCGAQRTVFLVGGTGGLAWFTFVWPVPHVITDFQVEFAYDDPQLAVDLGGRQPLLARRQVAFGSGPLWQEAGTAPQPSAFIVGNNETHTSMPISATASSQGNIVAASASVQVERLAPPIAVLAFGNVPYADSDGPAAIRVNSIDEALDAVGERVLVDVEELRPDPAILATWLGSVTVDDTLAVELAERLLLAANLFNRGLAGTVIVPAFGDDPHGAFNDLPTSSARADRLAGVLEGFYRELATAVEPDCGHDNAPLSVADNTVLLVAGDTPKNSFNNAGWPDGTVQNTNVLYVRSNGWVVPGWFGEITPAGRTPFNPDTGALDPAAPIDSNQAAAMNAVLYAVTRGDSAFVEAFDPSPFDGVKAPASP